MTSYSTAPQKEDDKSTLPVAVSIVSEPSISSSTSRCDLNHIYFEGLARPLRPSGRPGRGTRPSSLESSHHPARKSAHQPLPEEPPPDPFFVWLLGRFGLDPSAYRAVALARRLPSCLRQLRVNTTSEAKALLESRPELLGHALNSVLIGVTEFFRDRPVFEFLRDGLLQQLLLSRPGLRVLSAGCSDGQELYSVAMLLEALGALEHSELLGIDCRAAAIDRARAGVFDVHEAAGFEALLAPDRTRAGVSQTLRERCRWQVGDLLSCDLGASSWDIILCRNVTIYLNAAHAEQLWTTFASALAPGGVLIVGKAEKPPHSLNLSRVATCIYQKSGG